MQQAPEGRSVNRLTPKPRPVRAPAAFSFLVLDQLAGRLRHQLRAPPRAALREQQALAEDEAVEQESLRIGFFRAEAGWWAVNGFAGQNQVVWVGNGGMTVNW